MSNVVEFALVATDKFSSTFKGVASSLGSVAGFATKAIGVFTGLGSVLGGTVITKMAELQDETGKTAARLGIGTEALTKLQYAAGLADVSHSDLAVSLRNMQRAVSSASDGTSAAAETMKRLGVSVTELRKMSPDEQFKVFSDSLNKVTNSADRTTLSMELFGRGGSQMLTLTKEGSEGLNRLGAEAEKMGVTFGEQAAANAEAFNDSITRLGQSVTGVTSTVASVFMPIMTGAINAAAQFIASNKEALANFGKDALDAFLFVGVAAVQILDGLWKAIKRTFSAEGFNAFVEGAKNAFLRLLDMAINIVPEVGKIIFNMWRTAAVAGWELMKWAWDKVKSIFTGEDVPSLGEVLFSTIPKETEAARAELVRNFSAAGGQIVSLWDDVGSSIAEITGFSAEKVRATVDTIKAKYTEFGVAGKAAVATVTDETGALADKTRDKLKKSLNDVIDSLRTEEEKIKASYDQRLLILTQSNEASLLNTAEFLDLKTRLEDEAAKKSEELNSRELATRVQAVSQMFGNLSSLQNSHSKKEFERGKKFAKAQVAIDTAQAAIAAYKALAGIPFVGPALGVAAAAAAVIYGRQRLAEIDRQSFQGAAHAGLTSVPEDQTFFLKRGERVVAPEQNRDLTKFLQDRESNSSMSGGSVVIEHLHILENATNFDALMNMDTAQIERMIAAKLIPAFRRLAQRGVGGRVPLARQGLVNW